jgi:dihydroorotate dehydrogenase
MYSIVQRILFLLPPELAHHLVMRFLSIPGIKSIIRVLYKVDEPGLGRIFFNLKFSNPIGLAAGFDKDGQYMDVLAAMGFGFIELGTVTPLPQRGNPRPRLFRLRRDGALINRMGFNNQGVDALVKKIANWDKKNIIVGGNIGKNKMTPNERAYQDYEYCFKKLYDYVDYFAVNVSSPNTPGLRDLQEKQPLIFILNHLMGISRKKPIFLKIAPDLTDTQLDDIVEIVDRTGIHGVIATNTTIDRSGLRTPEKKLVSIGNGGLSGMPLCDRSLEVIRYLHTRSKGKIFIIGVGGIFKEEDAIEKLNAGASLVQLYSGLIYKGPDLIKRIKKTLIKSHIS